MTTDDLKLLATYALFGIRTINDANLENAAQSKLSESSKSWFGVFVTLHRNENEIQLDDPGARQIHGCLGHWSPRYQSMTPAELVEMVQQLVHDVRKKDYRRLNFDTDVDQDASATLEISFMNLPLREMDDASPETKTHFSNKKQGILVDSGSGKRATYLPGVFPNASWAYISQSLRQKAGLGRTTAARFYAYDATVVTFPVYEVLFSARSASYLRTDVALFYLKHYADFVPYEYNAATRVATINESDAVRNVACIGDVIGFAQDYRVVFENTPILPNLEHYYQKWLKAPTAYRQASIFLIRAYYRLGVHRSRVQLMSSQLYAALDRNALEPRFEMGEAVSVLAQTTSVPRIKTLKRALEFMRERAADMLYAGTTPLDNVFELNWQSQSVHQLFKLEPSESRASNASNASKIYVDHALLLFSVFVKTAQRTIVRLDSLETNYLAVIYECLSNLDAVMVLSERKQPAKHDQTAMVHDEIRNQRLRYFAALRRGEYGLYYFKDGKTARLDITGHIISF
uniref:AMMECR1 domain-containing protein n=1 Tax=viral metagenome TaxID=1070528 RepID=A0A6C0I6R1_9ZZZZ